MSGGNPFSGITDTISNVLGTDGSHGGLLGLGAQLDNSVRQVIPGGWATLGAVAAMIAAPYAAPELFASEAALPATSTGLTAAGTGASAGLSAAPVLGTAGSAAGIAGTEAAAGLTGLGAAAGVSQRLHLCWHQLKLVH